MARKTQQATERSLTLNPTQRRAADLGIELASLPAHVAIIMDGNGRWAQRKGLGRLIGHRHGYRTLRDILLTAGELGIRYLTAYAFSAENWRRPEIEVKGLMELIEQAARDELRLLSRNNVRWLISGRISELPEGLQQALREGVEGTMDNTGITLNLAVNYGGRAEIVDAVRELVRGGAKVDEIDEAAIARKLYQPDVPDPDLLIRTGAEMRWSNFLIWQAAYAELVVSEKTWPEFAEHDLLLAVLEYQSRTRRFGGL